MIITTKTTKKIIFRGLGFVAAVAAGSILIVHTVSAAPGQFAYVGQNPASNSEAKAPTSSAQETARGAGKADGKVPGIGGSAGVGSAGTTGGTAAGLAVAGVFASLSINNVLKATPTQRGDLDYGKIQHDTYVYVQGRTIQGKLIPLDHVKVQLRINNAGSHSARKGCTLPGQALIQQFPSQATGTKTGGPGTADFYNCPNVQFSIRLSHIPKDYAKLVRAGTGAAQVVRRGSDDGSPVKAVVTLQQVTPKKTDQEKCQDLLKGEPAPEGFYGSTGGTHFKTSSSGLSRTIRIYNILKPESPAKPKSVSKKCQETLAHSRNYTVYARVDDGRSTFEKPIRQSFSVKLAFHGGGTCATANPGRSGTDSKVEFKKCPRLLSTITITGISKQYKLVDQDRGAYALIGGLGGGRTPGGGSTVSIGLLFETP